MLLGQTTVQLDPSSHPGASIATPSLLQVGNDEAIEAKYLSLKTRFRKMEDSYRKELDSLHDEIAVLQDRMKKLDAAR